MKLLVTVLFTTLLTSCDQAKKTIKTICLKNHAYMYVEDTAMTPLFDDEGKPVKCKSSDPK